MLISILNLVYVAASVNKYLKGTNVSSKKHQDDTLGLRSTELMLKNMKVQWPHEKLGYTLHSRSEPSADRALQSGFNVDFLQWSLCGSAMSQLTNSLGNPLSSFSDNLVVNTCLICSNDAVPDIQSCKTIVSQSGNEVKYQLNTYTDDACTQGEIVNDPATWTTGTCYDDAQEYAYFPGVTDFSEFGDGVQYVKYSADSCSGSPIQKPHNGILQWFVLLLQ